VSALGALMARAGRARAALGCRYLDGVSDTEEACRCGALVSETGRTGGSFVGLMTEAGDNGIVLLVLLVPRDARIDGTRCCGSF
jgi:hypothetical protein